MPALEELEERMQQNSIIQFRLIQQTVRQSFSPKIDINIYRIIQELTTNSIKHAKATGILVQIIEHEDMIAITFEDNGIGFDPIFVQKKHESRGLKNIVSRVHTLDGAIQFDTLNDGEVIITIEIPINERMNIISSEIV